VAKGRGWEVKKVLEGLLILKKYFPEGDIAAQHDEIYAGGDASEVEISESDKKRLDDLGWFIDEEEDSWKKFV